MSRSTVISGLLLALLAYAASSRGEPPEVKEKVHPDPNNPLDGWKARKLEALSPDTIPRLKATRLDATRTTVDWRWREVAVGRGTLDFLIEAGWRNLDAELGLCQTQPERVRAHEKHWQLMRAIEDVNKARYDAGRVSHKELMESRSERLEAEIRLLRTRAGEVVEKRQLPFRGRPSGMEFQADNAR